MEEKYWKVCDRGKLQILQVRAPELVLVVCG